jgi:hypothetical protein
MKLQTQFFDKITISKQAENCNQRRGLKELNAIAVLTKPEMDKTLGGTVLNIGGSRTAIVPE